MMTKIVPSRGMGELLLIVVAAGWGVGFPLMKNAMSAHSVLTIMWLRFLLATLILLPFVWKRLKKLNIKTLVAGGSLGVLLFFSFLFLMYGLHLTSASSTGFLAGLCVIWTPLLERLLLGKSSTFATKIAVGFGLIGIFVMSGLDTLNINVGDALVLIGSVFTALHVLGIDFWSKHYDTSLLLLIQLATLTLLSCLVAILQGEELIPAAIDNTIIITLLFTAIFATTLAFWIQTTFQRYTTPTRAMLIYNLEPLFSALFAVILLEESLSLRISVGGMIIFMGMVLPGLYSLLLPRFNAQ